MSVSSRKRPQIILVLKPITSSSPFCHQCIIFTCQAPSTKKWSGFACSRRESKDFILKSLWGPSYFSAKRLLSSRSSVFPISTMTGSTFQCPGKWNYQLANCTGCSGGLPLRTTVQYCEFLEVFCLPPPHLTFKRKKKKKKAVSPNHLVCSPFHLEILWPCAIRFYFQKI